MAPGADEVRVKFREVKALRAIWLPEFFDGPRGFAEAATGEG
jgi:hypothetical protein